MNSNMTLINALIPNIHVVYFFQLSAVLLPFWLTAGLLLLWKTLITEASFVEFLSRYIPSFHLSTPLPTHHLGSVHYGLCVHDGHALQHIFPCLLRPLPRLRPGEGRTPRSPAGPPALLGRLLLLRLGQPLRPPPNLPHQGQLPRRHRSRQGVLRVGKAARQRQRQAHNNAIHNSSPRHNIQLVHVLEGEEVHERALPKGPNVLHWSVSQERDHTERDLQPPLHPLLLLLHRLSHPGRLPQS